MNRWGWRLPFLLALPPGLGHFGFQMTLKSRDSRMGQQPYRGFLVAMAAAITAPWNYALIRLFTGCPGATFVTDQFWCSLMFAPNVTVTTACEGYPCSDGKL